MAPTPITIRPDGQSWPTPPAGAPPESEMKAFLNDCEKGNEAEVVAYLKRWPEFPEVKMYNIESTSLIHAARYGHDKIVKILLEAGCPVGTQDADLNTALFAALTEGRFSTVKLLLDEGADLSVTPRFGKTAVATAVYSGNVELVNFLLEKGEKADGRDSYGGNALSELQWCRNEDFNFAELLVKHGADMNVVSQGGHTALSQCVQQGRTKFVRHLLDLGVELRGPFLPHNDDIKQMLADEPYRRESVRVAAIEAAAAEIRAREKAIENEVNAGLPSSVKVRPFRLKM
ncbi:MAG: ankyrin repeat domain-containing protein [Alphaproteobacteria bacterium]